MIYLDNSATTEPYPEVIHTFVTANERYFGNHLHYTKKVLKQRISCEKRGGPSLDC